MSAGALNLHWFLVYGDFSPPFELQVDRRTCPRPAGLAGHMLEASQGTPAAFRKGPVFDAVLRNHPQGIDADVLAATRAVEVRRNCADRADLLDLRSTIALVNAAIAGGVAVFDPLSIKWWSRAEWTELFAKRHDLLAGELVSIFVSGDWVHTRGMRQFGRPDISVRGVPESKPRSQAAIDLTQRFIDFQVRGGLIDPQRRLDVEGLPALGLELHGGDEAYDDPDFNNEWIEVLGFT